MYFLTNIFLSTKQLLNTFSTLHLSPPGVPGASSPVSVARLQWRNNADKKLSTKTLDWWRDFRLSRGTFPAARDTGEGWRKGGIIWHKRAEFHTSSTCLEGRGDNWARGTGLRRDVQMVYKGFDFKSCHWAHRVPVSSDHHTQYTVIVQ